MRQICYAVVYNSIAIHGKLEEIGWPEELDWHQSISITFDINDAEVNVNTMISLKKMAFYTQDLDESHEVPVSGKSFSETC
mgnify:CR=1 FL=1